jgi:acyl-CoA thioesterase II
VDLPPFPLLDLRPGEDDRHWRLRVRSELSTPFGALYGGSGIAAAAEAAEAATGRPLVWITTQFLGTPVPGDEVDLRVSLPATGRVTTQSQVVATVGERPMFTSLAAHTERAAGDEVAFLTMPEVPEPAACPPMPVPFEVEGLTFFDSMERRVAAGMPARDAVDRPQTGLMAIWCRLREGLVGSAATQAYVADIVPLAVCAALGIEPGGTSLDNTLRVLDRRPTDWVLIQLVAEGRHRSVGHGAVRLWAADGRLLGIGQQSALIRTSHHRR